MKKKKTATAKAKSKNVAVVKKPDLLTAAQIKKACPADVEQWGGQIAAHYKTALRYQDKADQQWLAIGKYLAQAKDACSDDGFTAFP